MKFSVGGVRFEYGIELVGQVREREGVRPRTSLYPTRGLESKEEPRRGRPFEEPEERAFLENWWADNLH